MKKYQISLISKVAQTSTAIQRVRSEGIAGEDGRAVADEHFLEVSTFYLI